jgi:hypothetical protein
MGGTLAQPAYVALDKRQGILAAALAKAMHGMI